MKMKNEQVQEKCTSIFVVSNYNMQINIYTIFKSQMSFQKFCLIFWTLSILLYNCEAIVDASRSLPHPTSMQSSIADLIITTTSSASSTYTSASFSNTYTVPKAILSISGLDFTPTATLSYSIGLNSISSSNILIDWSVGASTTIQKLKVTYFIYQYDVIKFPTGTLNYDAINTLTFVMTGSSTLSTMPGTIRSQEQFLSRSRYYSLDNTLVLLYINGVSASTVSTSYQISAKVSYIAYNSASFRIRTTVGEDTLLTNILIFCAIINQYQFSIERNIEVTRSILKYEYAQAEGSLNGYDPSNTFILVGLDSMTLDVGNRFEYVFDFISNYYPSDLANPTKSNSFNVFTMSQISCSASLNFPQQKCGTEAQFRQCTGYQHLIATNLSSTKQLIFSPGNKYFASCALRDLYIYEYDGTQDTYISYTNLTLKFNCVGLKFSKSWQYLAVYSNSEIAIYVRRGNYQLVNSFYYFDRPQQNIIGVDLSDNFLWMVVSSQESYAAGSSWGYFYYQKIFKYNQQTNTYEINTQFKGEIDSLALNNDASIFIRQNQMYYYSSDFDNWLGVPLAQGTQIAVRLNTEGTVQIIFAREGFYVYHINKQTHQRTLHQLIPNKYFFQPIVNYNYAFEMSDNGLKFVFQNFIKQAIQRIIIVYQRDTLNDLFIEADHLKVPTGYSTSLTKMGISGDGSVITSLHSSTSILVYYCPSAINLTETIPDAQNIDRYIHRDNDNNIIDNSNNTSDLDISMLTDKINTIESLMIVITVFVLLTLVAVMGVIVYLIKSSSVKINPQVQNNNNGDHLSGNSSMKFNNLHNSEITMIKEAVKDKKQFKEETKEDAELPIPKTRELKRKKRKKDEHLQDNCNLKSLDVLYLQS